MTSSDLRAKLVANRALKFLAAFLGIAGFAIVGLAMAVAGTLLAERGSSLASPPHGPIEIVEITTDCAPDGTVSGMITVRNRAEQPVSDQIPLLLTEHIPPSLGGNPHFMPTGVTTLVNVSLGPGEIATLPYGSLSTAGVDPDANALRVEVNTGLRSDLNPEKSESFPPCPPSPTNTPLPTATSTNTPPTQPTPTDTPLSEATPTDTPPSVATPTDTPSSQPTPTDTPESGATATPTDTPFSEVETAIVLTATPATEVAGLPSAGGDGLSSKGARSFQLAGTLLALLSLTGGLLLALRWWRPV